MKDLTMDRLKYLADMANPDFRKGYVQGANDCGRALIAVLHSLDMTSATVSVKDLWFANDKKLIIDHAYDDRTQFRYEDDPDGDA